MKKLVLFLVTLLMITSFNSTTVEAAKKKATKLNTTSVTLTVGKKKTLKLKNYTKLSKKKIKKVKWSTSDKKVVSLKVSGKYKQNCKITAKKAGKATIKVKYNGKTYKCKVVVKKTSTKTTKPTTEIPAEDVDPKKPNNNKPETPTQPGTTENTTESTTEDTSVNTDVNSTEDNHDCWFSAVDTHYDAEKVGDYGYTVWTCSKCGKELATIKDTDPKERTYEEKWETEVEPTCTTDGYQVQYKVYDDGTKEKVPNTKKVLPATGHTEVTTYTYIDEAGKIHNTCDCSHLKIYRTIKCSTCSKPIEENVEVLNTMDPTDDPYTVYLILRPNNYTDAWQNTYGTPAACRSEVRCNHCSHSISITNNHSVDELANKSITGWQSEPYKYKVVLNSIDPKMDTDVYTTNAIATIRSKVDEDKTTQN